MVSSKRPFVQANRYYKLTLFPGKREQLGPMECPGCLNGQYNQAKCIGISGMLHNEGLIGTTRMTKTASWTACTGRFMSGELVQHILSLTSPDQFIDLILILYPHLQ